MNIESLLFSQLLHNEQYARKVLPHLSDAYFSDDAEKKLFKLYQHFFTKYDKVPSKMALLVEIEKLKSSADVYTSIKTLIESQVEFTESLDYLVDATEKWVKEKSIYNAIRESILIVDGQSKTQTPDAIPTILQKALSICFNTSVGHNYFEDAAARYDKYHEVHARIPTGIPEIDKITKGGLPRKTLNLLLAPPHGGKTLTMTNIGHGAVMAGYNVLTITLEMDETEMSKRYDVQFLDVDFDTLQVLPKQVFVSKMGKIAAGSRGRHIIKEYPTKGAHVGHFRALLEELRIKQNFVPDLIIIDYLGICASENYKAGTNLSSYVEGKAVGEELRAFANTSNAAVVSAIQTNRSGISNSALDMTNISESLGSAMTADFILACAVTDELKDLSQILMIQIKNRYAGIADDPKFLMGVDYKKMKLISLDSGSMVKPNIPPPKASHIETANDTFTIDMLHTIKPVVATFDDFNF